MNAPSLLVSSTEHAAWITTSRAPFAAAAATQLPEKQQSSTSTSMAPLAAARDVRHMLSTWQSEHH